MLSSSMYTRTKKEFSANRLEQPQNGKNTYYLINCGSFESTTNPSSKEYLLKDHKYALKRGGKIIRITIK